MEYSPLVTAIRRTQGLTLNGCPTNTTSSSELTDLFFQIGAMRSWEEKQILELFGFALEKSPLDTLRMLFYSRDIRGGQGERRVFRTILTHLANGKYANLIEKNLFLVPVYGRWDDLLPLLDTKLENQVLHFISTALGDPVAKTLCAKWMPREKSSKAKYAEKIRKHMRLTKKQYRKLLSEATQVVETNMCAKNWEDIVFSHVPSKAMLNYRNAFKKHDQVRWEAYLTDLQEGTAKVNAEAVYPYEILQKLDSNAGSEVDSTLLDQQWKALPNYMENNSSRILPVVDTSGSMMNGYNMSKGLYPMTIAVSLGLYIAERHEGPFYKTFMTFSNTPVLQTISGSTLAQRVASIKRADWGMSTDLMAVFDLLLTAAKHNSVSVADMPDTILILSDMEFDGCVQNRSLTAYENIQQKYEAAGYALPKIIFWNLDAKTSNFPVKFDQNGTALVSGFSPSILKQILASTDISPEAIMRSVVNSERYSAVQLP